MWYFTTFYCQLSSATTANEWPIKGNIYIYMHEKYAFISLFWPEISIQSQSIHLYTNEENELAHSLCADRLHGFSSPEQREHNLNILTGDIQIIGWSPGITTLLLHIKKVAILVLKQNQTKSRITKLGMAVMIRCHVGKRKTENVDIS